MTRLDAGALGEISRAGVGGSVPAPGEYVALGAARQAAWARASAQGETAPKQWLRPETVVHEPAGTSTGASNGAAVRAAYRELRETMHPSTLS